MFVSIILYTESNKTSDASHRGVGPSLEDVAEYFNHATEKEKANEGDPGNHGKTDPVHLGGVVFHQIGYLDREIAGHEGYGEKKDAQLG